jgi:hypothetical protein
VRQGITSVKEDYMYIVDLAEEAKWFVIKLIKVLLQCTNDVDLNPAEGRTKIGQLKI